MYIMFCDAIILFYFLNYIVRILFKKCIFICYLKKKSWLVIVLYILKNLKDYQLPFLTHPWNLNTEFKGYFLKSDIYFAIKHFFYIKQDKLFFSKTYFIRKI